MSLLNPIEFDALVRRVSHEQAQDDSPLRSVATSLGLPATAASEELVRACMGQFEQGKSTAIERVLQALPATRDIALIRSRFSDLGSLASAPDTGHPSEDLRVDGGRSFVDRGSLRTLLQTLDKRSGSQVLVVHGQPGSGKSYCRMLVSHMIHAQRVREQRARPPELIYCDIPSLSDPRDPDVVLEALWDRASRSGMQRSSRAEHGHRKLKGGVEDLLDAIISSNNFVWIVIDGYHHKISIQVDGLISELCRKIPGSEAAYCCRVVLLGYPPKRPWMLEMGTTSLRRLELNPLDSGDVQEYLSEMVDDGKVAAALDLYHQYRGDYDADQFHNLSQAKKLQLALERTLQDVHPNW